MSDRQIRINADGVTLTATLNQSPTATKLWAVLPIVSHVQTWGDEIYFSIPLQEPEADDAQETVDRGAVAYWPPGNALCLFWGPTPMSRGNEIRPASAVNVIGQLRGNLDLLSDITSGAEITIEPD